MMQDHSMTPEERRIKQQEDQERFVREGKEALARMQEGMRLQEKQKRMQEKLLRKKRQEQSREKK